MDCSEIEVLEKGSSLQKIETLSRLDTTDNPEIIQKIIERLDDDDLQVRGEAFSSLVLNEHNNIYNYLILNLESASKNIRGFVSLILANRHESGAIPYMVRLACDESAMVRSCAIGALGYLNAQDDDAQDAMVQSLFDKNADVKKSAAHSLVITGRGIVASIVHRLSIEWAEEMRDDPDLKVLYERLASMPAAYVLDHTVTRPTSIHPT